MKTQERSNKKQNGQHNQEKKSDLDLTTGSPAVKPIHHHRAGGYNSRTPYSHDQEANGYSSRGSRNSWAG